jgi:hypothetical protein
MLRFVSGAGVENLGPGEGMRSLSVRSIGFPSV